MRSEIAHPCWRSSAIALRISRSSVPCGRSMALPFRFDKSVADLVSKRKGSTRRDGAAVLYSSGMSPTDEDVDGTLDRRAFMEALAGLPVAAGVAAGAPGPANSSAHHHP